MIRARTVVTAGMLVPTLRLRFHHLGRENSKRFDINFQIQVGLYFRPLWYRSRGEGGAKERSLVWRHLMPIRHVVQRSIIPGSGRI